MIMSVRNLFLASLLIVFVSTVARAQEKPVGKKAVDPNHESVSKVYTSLVKAFNAKDSKGVSELFTPTGEFVDGDGNVFQGRDKIAAEFAALFANGEKKKNTFDISAGEIRDLSPGLLSVDSIAKIASADGADTVSIDFTSILVKQGDGKWLLASIRSDGESSQPTPHARLKQLEWLIGDWIDESQAATLHTNNRWSEDGNFIITEFTVSVAGRMIKGGTQRIGWDGALEKFKSWVFDADGGHAVAIWTEIDGVWIVKSTGVRADGTPGSATQTYEQAGTEAFVLTVTDRIQGNEILPDFKSRVVRKPPEPAKAGKPAPAAK